MLSFGHTAVGVASGLTVYHFLGNSSPAITVLAAGSAGLTSHYLTDILPHGHFFVTKDKNFNRNIILTILFDFLSPALLFLYLIYQQTGLSILLFTILFAIGGAQLPDILDNLIGLKVLPRKGILKFENHYHQMTHWHGSGDHGLLLSWFDLWQVTVFLTVLGIVISSNHT